MKWILGVNWIHLAQSRDDPWALVFTECCLLKHRIRRSVVFS